MSNFYRFRGYEFRVDVDKVTKILRKKKSPHARRRRKVKSEDPYNSQGIDMKYGMNRIEKAAENTDASRNLFKYPLLSFEESSAKSYRQSFYKAQQKILNLEKLNDDLKKSLEVKENENRRMIEKIKMMRNAFQSNYDIYILKLSERDSERENCLQENLELKNKLKKLQIKTVAKAEKKKTMSHYRNVNNELRMELEKIKEEKVEVEKKCTYFEESLGRLERKLQNEEEKEDNMFYSKLEVMMDEKSQIYEKERREMSGFVGDIQKKLDSKNDEVKRLRKGVKKLRELCESLRKKVKEYERSGGGGSSSRRSAGGDSREKKFLPKLGEDSKYRVAVSDM